jgi:hypothetical protein
MELLFVKGFALARFKRHNITGALLRPAESTSTSRPADALAYPGQCGNGKRRVWLIRRPIEQIGLRDYDPAFGPHVRLLARLSGLIRRISGESGIRYLESLLVSSSYRFSVAALPRLPFSPPTIARYCTLAARFNRTPSRATPDYQAGSPPLSVGQSPQEWLL